MRITHAMISAQYVRQLNKALNNLNDATTQATDYRNFNKASDDPFAASRAYRLRNEYQQNQDYQSSLSDASSQLETAQSSMMSINKMMQEVSSGDCLQAINGTMSPDDRSIIATKLRKVQDEIVSELNTQFADKYVFGGANTDDPPFSVDDNGNLLYHGIDVNTGAIAAGTTTTINGATMQFGKTTGTSFNGYTVSVAAGAAGSPDTVSVSGTTITVAMDLTGGKTNKDLLNALKSATGLTDAGGNALDFSNVTMSGDMNLAVAEGTSSAAAYDTVGQDGLKTLAKETSYVDLGMGLRFNSDGSVNTQSVFNTAIPGLSFMGYGTSDGTSSGMPSNLYTQLGKIADQLESGSFSIDAVQPYLNAFSSGEQNLLSKITESGTNSSFLTAKKTQLEDQGDSITEKDDDVEYMDPAEAIMNYKMQEYSYRAALQMGTNILQPTFLDFMK